VKEGYIFLT